MQVKEASAGAELAGPRFVVDVVCALSDGEPQRCPGGPSAAAVLEVAGWERGPLLVSALEDTRQAEDGALVRVWRDVPMDILHPPKVRTRRRSHRRTSTTTTEGYTSAENPVRSEYRQLCTRVDIVT